MPCSMARMATVTVSFCFKKSSENASFVFFRMVFVHSPDATFLFVEKNSETKNHGNQGRVRKATEGSGPTDLSLSSPSPLPPSKRIFPDFSNAT